MSKERFEALVLGAEPTKDDYILFVAMMEHCSTDVLWDILNNAKDLNWMLKAVITKSLQEKVRSEISNDMLLGILKNLKESGYGS